MLTDISDVNTPQADFLISKQSQNKDTSLMQTIDDLNRKLGRKTLYFGTQAQGIKHYIKREFKSRSYTTSWNELPIVN